MDTLAFFLDCDQSLFSSKIHGKEHKTSKQANVTVSVTSDQRAASMGVGRRANLSFRLSPNAHATPMSHSSHVTLIVKFARIPVLRSFPRT